MPIHKDAPYSELHSSKVAGTNGNVVSITDNIAVDSGIALADLDVGIFTRDAPTTTVSLVNSGDTVDLDGILQVDTMNEHTAATGVTIDGVLLKDNGIDASGTITVDTIGEHTASSGVTIDSVLLKDGGADLSGTLTVNLIQEHTLDNGIDIEGVDIKDGNVYGGYLSASLGVYADVIDEYTTDTGVTVDGVLLKDNDVAATDITASGTIYGALDKVNVATGGSLPTTGWSSASGTDWNYYYDYSVTGLTTSDFVIVSVDKDGLDDAQYSEVAPSVDSVSGAIRFYCNTVPTTAISFDYTVIKG